MDIPFLYCVAGFILLGVSGEALLRGAVTTADRLKVPPLLIGLTVIAFGTSIPELTVSLNAARSGNPDIAVGQCCRQQYRQYFAGAGGHGLFPLIHN